MGKKINVKNQKHLGLKYLVPLLLLTVEKRKS
jgi:hypothetical protein